MTTTDLGQPTPTPRAVQVLAPATVLTATGSWLLHFDNIDVEAMQLVLNISGSPTGTSPTLTLKAEGWDPYAAVAYPLGTGSGLTTTALNTSGVSVLRIVKSGTNSGTVAQDMVPPHLLITATLGGTTPSFTVSLTAMMDL